MQRNLLRLNALYGKIWFDRYDMGEQFFGIFFRQLLWIGDIADSYGKEIEDF